MDATSARDVLLDPDLDAARTSMDYVMSFPRSIQFYKEFRREIRNRMDRHAAQYLGSRGSGRMQAVALHYPLHRLRGRRVSLQIPFQECQILLSMLAD